MTKKLLLLLLTLLPVAVAAQILEPIKWTSDFKVNGSEATLTFTATIDGGWHLYATELPPLDFGPSPTAIVYDSATGLTPVGKITSTPAPTELYEEMFDGNVRYWEHKVTLTQKFNVTGEVALAGYVEYQACNDENCIPPSKYEFSYSAPAPAVAAAVAVTPAEPVEESAEELSVIEEVIEEVIPALAPAVATTSTSIADNPLW